MASVETTDFIDLESIDVEVGIDKEVGIGIDEEVGFDEELSSPKNKTEEDLIECISTPKKPSLSNELRVRKIFKSLEEAENCYTKYPGSNGFDVRRRSTYTSKSGELNGMVFVCSCEGIYRPKKPIEEDVKARKKPTRMGSTVKTGCGAKMRVRLLEASNEWEVTIFVDAHNHHLVTPTKRIHLRSNRNMPKEAKIVVQCLKEINVPVNKVVPLFGDRDKVPFDNRDVWNHMRAIRKINYQNGDAEGVKSYFERAAAENAYFYYAIQCDEFGRAANFFWIDARSRIAYGQFGDAITFDTTYNTNRYKMPFAPFTGVNHHRQSVLFGCALLENETEETFTWLFQTWLRAMGGKAPSAIITDQDPAMSKAIATVFPNARHRFCLWHIKKKFVEKFGIIYAQRPEFKGEVKKVSRFCHSIEEFEEKWADMLVKYGLSENLWLKHMYAIRKKWIPVYCRGGFWAGMNTTQRSESMNSFFDKFVDDDTNLQQFVARFDQAVMQIYVCERTEDYFSIYKKRCLIAEDYLIEHDERIYTRNMFAMFIEEYNHMRRLKIDVQGTEGDVCSYIVGYRFGDTYGWLVTFNSATFEGVCECKLFEFYGYPCKHLLKVFDSHCLNEIPPHFIMKRWMKDANREQVCASDGNVMRNKDIGMVAARIVEMTRRATQLPYMMCKSDEGYEMLCELFDKAFISARNLDVTLLERENANANANEDDGPSFIFQGAATGASNVNGLLLDPPISRTKGRKRVAKEGHVIDSSSQLSSMIGTCSQRIKPGIEKSMLKKQRKCATCKGANVRHDSRNCPSKNKIDA